MAKNVLLNVTGSISCFKACTLISLLTKNDYNVRVIATEDALKFVGKASFEGLSHNKLETSMFDNDDPIAHIHLAQNWADLIISYPSSANTINRLACGLSDDLFGAVCLANNFNKLTVWINIDIILISSFIVFLLSYLDDSIKQRKRTLITAFVIMIVIICGCFTALYIMDNKKSNENVI